MPNSFSASVKASSKFSLLLLLRTLSMSTRSGLMACTTDWNATPSRQLEPKSFTSIPWCLKDTLISSSALHTCSILLDCNLDEAYLAAVNCTHLSRALLALPWNFLTTFLFMGGLPVSELAKLSTEELLLDNACRAGRLLVNSSI